MVLCVVLCVVFSVVLCGVKCGIMCGVMCSVQCGVKCLVRRLVGVLVELDLRWSHLTCGIEVTCSVGRSHVWWWSRVVVVTCGVIATALVMVCGDVLHSNPVM